MEPGLSFADIVRKTHQDEIERSLTTPESTAFLARTFSGAEPYILPDACMIARHHRFNPLSGAPDHLQDLCALMRLIDELDIGPRRAPTPTYDVLRDRMDTISRFHWLKHICARDIDRDTTFTIEIPSESRRVLKFWIAVKATSDTWSPLQDQILAKLRHCIEEEGVNRILRERLDVEVVLERGAGIHDAADALGLRADARLRDRPRDPGAGGGAACQHVTRGSLYQARLGTRSPSG